MSGTIIAVIILILAIGAVGMIFLRKEKKML